MNFKSLARSRSQDQAQEALRERKSKWNEAVSELIVKLIVLKRGMNGRGDQEVGIPASDIKNPLPEEVSIYLGSVADDYHRVMSEGNSIIQHQYQYSSSRKKSKKEMRESEALASHQPFLEARAGIMSRFWLSGMDEEQKSTRLKMIRFLDLAEYKLHDVEDYLLDNFDKNPNSLAYAVIELLNLAIKFSEVYLPNVKELANIANINDKLMIPPMGHKPKVETETLQYIISVLQEADAIDSVYHYIAPKLPSEIRNNVSISYQKLSNVLRTYNEAILNGVDPRALLGGTSSVVAPEYRRLLEVAQKVIGPAKSFEELRAKIPLYEEEKEAIKKHNEEFEKIAHNVVTRWLKRKWHEIGPSNMIKMLKGKAIAGVLKANKGLVVLIKLLNNKNSDPLDTFNASKQLAIYFYEIVTHLLPLVEIRINEQAMKKMEMPKGEKLLLITSQQKKSLKQVQRNIKSWIDYYGGINAG